MFTLLLLAGASEALTFFFRSRGLRGLLLSVAVAAAAVPALYLNVAAFPGRAQADFNTWHLLPMFAAMYQVFAMMLVAVAFVAACGLRLLVKGVASRLRPPGPTRSPEH